MSEALSILLLEDEPLILMDLELAAEERGCRVISASTCKAALDLIETGIAIDVAILDVSLSGGDTCFPVARLLDRAKIPYILHSGDLDRHDEKLRQLDAELIAKPTASDKVIAAAIMHCAGGNPDGYGIAAE